MKASITNLGNPEEFKLSNNPEKVKDQCFEFHTYIKKSQSIVAIGYLSSVVFFVRLRSLRGVPFEK